MKNCLYSLLVEVYNEETLSIFIYYTLLVKKGVVDRENVWKVYSPLLLIRSSGVARKFFQT